MTSLCLDFSSPAEVTLYSLSCFLEIAKSRVSNRDYFTCFMCTKLGLFSLWPVLHFTALLLIFSLFLQFCSFIFTVFHWAQLFRSDISEAIICIFLRVKECCESPNTGLKRFMSTEYPPISSISWLQKCSALVVDRCSVSKVDLISSFSLYSDKGGGRVCYQTVLLFSRPQ